jgi:hypothetical protein
MFTTQETRKHRQDICETCPSKNGVRCSECGCFLIFLRKASFAKCPLNKWNNT